MKNVSKWMQKLSMLWANEYKLEGICFIKKQTSFSFLYFTEIIKGNSMQFWGVAHEDISNNLA